MDRIKVAFATDNGKTFMNRHFVHIQGEKIILETMIYKQQGENTLTA